MKTRKTTETKPAKKSAAKKTEPAKAVKPAKAAKPASPKASEPPKSPKAPITHEMIEKRAYEIWVAAGRPHGQDHEIWVRAEAELRAEAGARR